MIVSNIVGEPDVNPANIPERIVQDVWLNQRFRTTSLQTTEGSILVIEDQGHINLDQGPDFLDARLTLDGVPWCGAVEIHRCSGDWYRHGHDSDPVYNNVVLHATLLADRHTGKLLRQDGSTIPEIVLLPRLENSLRRLAWTQQTEMHRSFPCEKHWPGAASEIVDPFVFELARRRLARKASRLSDRLAESGDPDTVAYEEVFRALGYLPNAESMVVLARRVPRGVAALLSSREDFLSMLLGTGGLLPLPSEYVHGDRSAVDFAMRLRERYEELNRDLGIRPLPRQIWRFSRLRPANAPQLRVAQASGLFGRDGPLSNRPCAKILEALSDREAPESLNYLLESDPGEFWSTHVSLLKRRTRNRVASIGPDRRTTLIVNAFLPVAIVCSAQSTPTPAAVEEQALKTLAALPAQTDRVTRPYARRGQPTSAAVTQGLHELSAHWCSHGRCLECPVGRHLSRAGCRFAG